MIRLGKGILVALGLVLALAPAAWAGGYTFVDIDYPGATNTVMEGRGINNLGQIVGSYTLGGVQYAFIKNGDTYSTISNIPGTNKAALGINDAGEVAGYYQVAGLSANHGFIYNTKNDTVTTIDFFDAVSTTVWGINDADQISGYYYNNGNYGFLHKVDSTSWYYCDIPGSTLTQVYGINNDGVIVGIYTKDGHDHGFIYNVNNNTSQTYEVPGAQNTRLVGINDHGDLVGRYWNDGGAIYGFVHTNGYASGYSKGVFQTLEMSGAEIVRVLGINNAGRIVGLYTRDGGTTYHGFLGTPVQGLPALFLLLND